MDNDKEMRQCFKCKKDFDYIETRGICPHCGCDNQAAHKRVGCGCLIAVIIAFVIVLALAVCSDTPQNVEQQAQQLTNADAPKWIIAAHEYGNNYPYTEDSLTIYCYNNAVWLEDALSNKYALNGFAINLLKAKKTYKGTTELILKPNMSNVYLPQEAQNYCIKLSDGEFEAIK